MSMVLPAIEESLRLAQLFRRLPRPADRARIRKRAGVPQTAIAEACGVTRVAVSRWESGRRRPGAGTIERYVACLERLAEAHTEVGSS